MKKLFLLPIALSLFFFLSCKKDDPTVPIDDTGVENPIQEDTVVLKPFWFVRNEIYFGFAQAVWQDSFFWDASGSASQQFWHSTNPEAYFNISFQTFEPSDHPGIFYDRQDLFISEIPLNHTGSYSISGGTWDLDDGMIGARFFTTTDDGDVAEDSYIVDETATDNVLVITEVDTMEQIYKGTFTVSFEISTQGGKRNPDNPDNLKIKDAVFLVKIF